MEDVDGLLIYFFFPDNKSKLANNRAIQNRSHFRTPKFNKANHSPSNFKQKEIVTRMDKEYSERETENFKHARIFPLL